MRLGLTGCSRVATPAPLDRCSPARQRRLERNSKGKKGDLRSDGDVLCSTNRMGPDLEILPKFSDLTPAVYAGPAFNISSPSPSSLPFPAFFLKKSADEAVKSEIATRGLRCLLRLDEIA